MKIRDILAAQPVSPVEPSPVQRLQPTSVRIVGEAIYPTPEPAPFYDDARENEQEAVTWLRAQLATGPQHIADLFSEWCADVVGRPSHEISARMDLLNDARWALEVHAYIGTDDRFWWRLPQKLEQ